MGYKTETGGIRELENKKKRKKEERKAGKEEKEDRVGRGREERVN
jgi:hypothetical protein